ncbi:MAG: hypothetical protein LBP91_01820 [Coriobacteriales bacterium]|jgi:hypothetical protein|nr:hypothetical protein [Coriobacteriales bacterium]
MALLVALLRIVLPLIILAIILRFVLPRIRQTGQKRSDRIDVDATVVGSEQLEVDLEGYEPSEVYVKQQSLQKEENE